eukprot:2507802-Ditylum_brightwellii.AAC.1
MKTTLAQLAESFHIKDLKGIDDMVGQIAGSRYRTILKAKYEKIDLKKELFDGSLGTWKNTKYNVELKLGVTPYHGRPYFIPQAYKQQL